mmetsp:Transcript_16946/g.55218  ORF Transcript_16946/g.55218 Transcript_16946/m.55218 type:complete len:131 (-) Transcript_16946:381-773(-)
MRATPGKPTCSPAAAARDVSPTELLQKPFPASPPPHQASWAAYLAGTSARLLTSLTGVDFKPTGGARDPIDGRARPVYRAAEAHALLADVLAQLDESEPLAPPGLRRNAQFGVGGFIATLPDMAPQGIAM